MFISKTNKVYLWNDFSSTSILNKIDILSNYSLEELDMIYKANQLGDISYMYKDILLKQSIIYDLSDEVNSFIYKGNKYWLDKLQRSCMKTVAESGLENVEVVLGEFNMVLSSDLLKQLILLLEAYAYKCYVVTAKHLLKIKSLQSIEDIINYNYKTGYPEKLVLE